MKKTLILTSLVFITLAGCQKKLPDTTYYDDEQKKIKTTTLILGFSTFMEDPRGIASQLFKKEVEKRTDNRICIEIHPKGTLGNDEELIRKIVSGEIDMTVSSSGNFASLEHFIGISALPFLFDNFDSAWEFLDGPLGKQINSTFEEKGITVLSYFDNGFRCITTTDRPIYSADDMKGLHIRTAPNIIVTTMMEELGAEPEVYPFSLLKDALKSGMFEAQENPIPVILNNYLYEVQSYLAVINFSYDAMPFVIRKDIFEMFTDSDKEILLDAAQEASVLNRIITREQTENYLQLLQSQGLTVTYPEKEGFKKAGISVIEKLYPEHKDELIKLIK